MAYLLYNNAACIISVFNFYLIRRTQNSHNKIKRIPLRSVYYLRPRTLINYLIFFNQIRFVRTSCTRTAEYTCTVCVYD